jgi:hypothetical protein
MYSHEQNQPSAVTKNTFKLKNPVQTDSTCMKLIDNYGSFTMNWKANFDLKTIVLLSTPPPPLGGTAFPSPVNDIQIKPGSSADKFFYGLYDNPEMKINTITQFIKVQSMQAATGTFTYCSVAVLSPCNCYTTSYQDNNILTRFRNPATMLLDGSATVTVDLNTVAAVQTYSLRDVQTLSDSVSLACSATGDFCGVKELFLWYNSAAISFTSLPVGWSYNSATRVLSIDPLKVT